MIAAYQGHSKVVEVLLKDKRTDASIQDRFGKKAQDRAKDTAIYQTIVEAAIDQRMREASASAKKGRAKSKDRDRSASRGRSRVNEKSAGKDIESGADKRLTLS